MATRIEFERRYMVKIPEREDWEKGRMIKPENGLVIYTDGLKTEGGTAAGFFSENPALDRSYRLESHVSVFALLKASESARKITTESITMFLDSRVALLAHRTNSRLVCGCGEALTELTERAAVTLVWVPGHRGIPGNEKADELARTGAADEQQVAEVGIGRSLATVKAELKEDRTKMDREE